MPIAKRTRKSCKTTIADCLISTNGIISQRSAGKLRYMDNTAYEQARGITVKSSCISLHYSSTSTSSSSSSGQPKDTADKQSPLQSSAELELSKPSLNSQDYLINLIDSPGHMDFSGEVSSALRMTDGCFVVVDAIEGVCIQTRAVLRQAWIEKVKPTLVINKIDKLFSLLQLGPDEAYRQLLKVVGSVNEVIGNLWIEQKIGDAEQQHLENLSKREATRSNQEDGVEFDASTENVDALEDDEHLFFSPEKGNVVFVSAIHGWGFSIEDFVEMYATKLKMSRKILRKTLWGEYYLNVKTKKIATRKTSPNAMTMFSALILSNIYQIYSAILGNASDMASTASHKGYNPLTHRDMEKLNKIDKALNLSVPPREAKIEDINQAISSYMSRWLPISRSLLELAVHKLPNPIEAQASRISRLWTPSTHDMSPHGIQLQQNFKHSLMVCDNEYEKAPVIAYVSKVFAVPNKQFPQSSKIKLDPEGKTFIAMTRLFSGSLKPGDDVFLCNARYKPSQGSNSKHFIKVKVPQLWILMGPDLQPIEKAEAGCVFGIGGETLEFQRELLEAAQQAHLESQSNTSESSTNDTTPNEPEMVVVAETASSTSSTKSTNRRARPPQSSIPSISITNIQRNEFVSHIVKTATLTNNLSCPSFGALTRHVNPIVRVAVEPESASDLQKLEKAMWQLHQADAAVHVEVQENGELIIGALGELHLQRCLEMLKDDFAKDVSGIKVSKPVVSFRETIKKGLAINEETKEVVSTDIVVERSADRYITITIRATPIPENITQWLETHADETRTVVNIASGMSKYQESHQTENTKIQPSSGESQTTVDLENTVNSWKNALLKELETCGKDWQEQAQFIWALGPHRIGPNILLNNIPKYSTSPYWRGLLSTLSDTSAVPKPVQDPASFFSQPVDPNMIYSKNELVWFSILQTLENGLKTGFQVATKAGPLCEEPLMGVAIQVLDINISHVPHPQESTVLTVPKDAFLIPEPLSLEEQIALSKHTGGSSDIKRKPISQTLSSASYGKMKDLIDENDLPLTDQELMNLNNSASDWTGSVIAASRTAIRKAFLARTQRLYEAMYLAHIQVSAIQMGKAYAVLNKRRADILRDEVNESSGLTLVVAHVPAAEAFGFSEELVSKSGGAASAQLTFAAWKMFDVDPNFVPTTEEELEEFGDNVGAIPPNLARLYVDGVRKRKGLQVREKLVEGADKQRTLSKKK